ncbi:MAG: TetR/AcrR family transcriptional regulator [Planctomycetia bacterium]|nr:TetR/AcrR family transcriptional regulator [Planctomycetia bacterium]
MKTLSRKQREVQEREARILEVAQELLVQHGYHGLSMDRIAEVLEYSKGTMYQHFSCKEEVLLALANQALAVRLQMFRCAAAYRGRTRERLIATGLASELFVKLFPHHFTVEQVIRLPSVWEKTSPRRRDAMRAFEMQCIAVIGGIVRDAIACGDMELPTGTSPEHIVFGLWSMTFGALSIAMTSVSLSDAGLQDPLAVLHENQSRLVDGYGWRPLSHEYDYQATAEKILSTVFSAESRAAAARNRA